DRTSSRSLFLSSPKTHAPLLPLPQLGLPLPPSPCSRPLHLAPGAPAPPRPLAMQASPQKRASAPAPAPPGSSHAQRRTSMEPASPSSTLHTRKVSATGRGRPGRQRARRPAAHPGAYVRSLATPAPSLLILTCP
uniref:Uncharacterized protein n=4 Tax=Aegilops tauschii subsp. strangulata TaxID=200361 RepID=A0A453NU34_AEGTS